jgi:glucuronate isomerase
MIPLSLHPDRLFSSDPMQRDLSRALYAAVKDLPIVSPHGHTDPQWYADNEPFTNASALLITPDHYVFRMLYSQGVKLEDLAITPRRRRGRARCAQDLAHICGNYRLFRGTPTRIWLDHAFHEVFGSAAPGASPRIHLRSDQRLPRQARVPSAHCSSASTSRSSRRPSRRSTLVHHAAPTAAGKGAS